MSSHLSFFSIALRSGDLFWRKTLRRGSIERVLHSSFSSSASTIWSPKVWLHSPVSRNSASLSRSFSSAARQAMIASLFSVLTQAFVNAALASTKRHSFLSGGALAAGGFAVLASLAWRRCSSCSLSQSRKLTSAYVCGSAKAHEMEI